MLSFFTLVATLTIYLPQTVSPLRWPGLLQ